MKENMKITISNAKQYASNVMDSKQVSDYNAWAGTNYSDKETLLANETSEKVAEFFNP